MASVVTFLYGVAYLPWYLKDRKAKKQTETIETAKELETV
jgi:hypothetical protein